MSKKPKQATTQSFIEIEKIIDDVVFLRNGGACLAIEIMAVNFALLSKEEQDIKIASYASLLNSLPFSIQIFIRTDKINISSYLKLLEEQEGKAPNSVLAQRIRLYKDFVAEMVKVNTVLEKAFYVVIPYSPLEKGLQGASSLAGKGNREKVETETISSLRLKAKSLHEQLRRLNLRAKTLEKEELVSLFYEVYNGTYLDSAQTADFNKLIAGGQN